MGASCCEEICAEFWRIGPLKDEIRFEIVQVRQGDSGLNMIADSSPPALDLLSDIFAGHALRTSMIASFRLATPWGLDVPHFGPALLYAVIEGRIELEVREEPVCQAFAGDVVLLPRGASHAVRSDGEAETTNVLSFIEDQGQRAWRPGDRAEAPILVDLGGRGRACRFLVVLLDFQDAAPNALRLNLPELIHLRAAESGVTPWLQPAVESIVAGLAQGRLGYVALTTKLAELVFIDTIRSYVNLRPDAAGGWLRAMSHPRLARALAELHRDPARRWTIAAMARVAGMSRSSFAGTFCKVVGQTPFSYLTHLRMTLAAARIASGERSVKAAAHEQGYASEKAFSHAFRRTAGAPPGSLKPNAVALGYRRGR